MAERRLKDMTNLEIIEKAKKAHGVDEEVDTYQGWKRCGRQVQKGQRALFKAVIWKPVDKKIESDTVMEADDEGNPNMIMVNASFFGMSQTKEQEAKNNV